MGADRGCRDGRHGSPGRPCASGLAPLSRNGLAFSADSGGTWSRRPSRPGGRAAGARPSGFPRRRPDDDGHSARARPVGLAGPSVGAGDQSRRQAGHARASRPPSRRDLRRAARCFWSAGASAACSRGELAHRHPDKVRAVVTLVLAFLRRLQDQHQRPRAVRADRRAMTSTSRRFRAARRQAAGADPGLLVAAGRDRRAERRARARP